jgi:ribosomal protein S18 acetylase RimI-like enzyme
MSPTPSSFPPHQLLEVRSAREEDRQDISNLIFSESHVHKHLDWKAPLEWLGHQPFVVLQEGSHLAAALACPPDPAEVAWLRLFVFNSQLNGAMAWRMLWPAVQEMLEAQGCSTAAAIAVQRWLDPILVDNGFELVNHIVLMELDTQSAASRQTASQYPIRPMVLADLPHVVELDAAAFEPLWRNSLDALTHAFGQATYASVAEADTGPVGYQLSTGGAFGTHLARLAVSPVAQHRGLGAALIHDLIAHISPGREPRLTLNTQSNNAASHALYARIGFRRTGERFPVFALSVPGRASQSAGRSGIAK